MSSIELTQVSGTDDAGFRPYWFDLWQNDGWSRRVARNWSQDSAYRGNDRAYLQMVFPTLAPHQMNFVQRVLQDESQQLFA